MHHGGRNSFGPDNAFIVVTLLHSGGNESGYAHAITAHDQFSRNALSILDGNVHGGRVFGSKFKDMADLNTAYEFKGTAGIDGGVTFDHVTDVDDSSCSCISFPVDTGEVEAVFVGTTDKITDGRRTTIDTNRDA